MSFAEIKGHAMQIRNLVDSVNLLRLSNAYLFLGPSGIGKKFVALNFAKFLNCSESKDGGKEPCDQCSSCRKIDSFTHPDVLLVHLKNSDSIGIAYIREMERRACFKPYESKNKIFIIDDSENLTIESANALLKTLEESQKDTVFILIATQENKLPATVVSRCRRIKFNALSPDKIKEILVDDHNVSKEQAHFISCFCESNLSSALEIKDRDILKEKNAVINDFIDKRISFKDRNAAYPGLNICLGWLRDLLLLKIGKKDSFLINLDRKQDLIKNKNKYTIGQLISLVGFTTKALAYLEKNINVRLLNNLLRLELCRD